MTEAWPDIEIYIKDASADAIKAWLDDRFGLMSESQQGDALNCRLGAEHMECVIVENAAKGGFTSVWFKSDRTPWPDDTSCAREAFARFGTEIRSSTAPWQEGEDETTAGGWLSISDGGERIINWF